MIKRLLLFLFLCRLCFGAFTATTHWNVQTGGSDSNGGGFDTSASGTDKSQGSATAFTDLVINATTTKGSSTTLAFDATSPGNILNVTGGAGCTVQRVQISSQVAGLATFDKTLGTAGSTCTGTAYGPLLTIGKADSLVVSLNTIDIKAGTYTLTSAIAMTAVSHTFKGYNSTPGDGGTKPLITTATNSTNLFTGNGNISYIYVNLSMSNTAGTRADAIHATGSFPGFYVLNCLLDGFDQAINGSTGGSDGALQVVGTEIKNSVTAAIVGQFDIMVIGSWIHDGTKDGVVCKQANQAVSSVNTVYSNNGRYAVYGNNAAPYVLNSNSVFYKNGLTFTGHPFSQINVDASGAQESTNTIYYGGAASNFNSTAGIVIGRNNALDSQAMGSVIYTTVSDQSLSADPFTNAASGDFSLNNTAGGGNACRGTGFPGAGPAGTGYADIGAIQTGVASSPGVCSQRSFACAH